MLLDIQWPLVIPATAAAVGLISLLAKPVGKWMDRRSDERSRRKGAHERIYNEAVALERELRAGLWEPRNDQLGVWAQSCQQGFNLVEGRFNKLADLAVEASPRVKQLVRVERERFLHAANDINEVLVGALDQTKYARIRSARGQLLRCRAGVAAVIRATR